MTDSLKLSLVFIQIKWDGYLLWFETNMKRPIHTAIAEIKWYNTSSQIGIFCLAYQVPKVIFDNLAFKMYHILIISFSIYALS